MNNFVILLIFCMFVILLIFYMFGLLWGRLCPTHTCSIEREREREGEGGRERLVQIRHNGTHFTQLTLLILCWIVTKADELAWGEMKPEIFSAMMDFFASGLCVTSSYIVSHHHCKRVVG
jgi:hypothetical protein